MRKCESTKAGLGAAGSHQAPAERPWFPSRPWAKAAEAARSVCAACPAREPCLAYALANPELVGVWGATTTRERRALRRRA